MMRLLLIVSASLMLAGCWQSREEKQTETVRDEQTNFSGSISIPLPVPHADGTTGIQLVEVPINITATKRATDSTQERSETKSGADGAAVAGLVLAGLKQAFPALQGLSALSSGLSGQAASSQPWIGKEGGTATITGLVTLGLGYASKQLLAAREKNKAISDQKVKHAAEIAERDERIERLRIDRDQHQQRALELALKLPPERA